MKAKVEQSTCIGSGMCVSLAPEVFELGDDGLSEAVNPNPNDDALLREAAESCPAQAIRLMDDEDRQVYP